MNSVLVCQTRTNINLDLICQTHTSEYLLYFTKYKMFIIDNVGWTVGMTSSQQKNLA